MENAVCSERCVASAGRASRRVFLVASVRGIAEGLPCG
jgi:hypothetical protein